MESKFTYERKGHPQTMCGLDYALADIAAGRIHHYASLDELKAKFE